MIRSLVKSSGIVRFTGPRYSITTVPTLRDDVFTISLVGKPNVGKSTLFNRFTVGANALVHKMPGLTRDRKELITKLLGIPIRIVDTAGIELKLFQEDKSRELNKHIIHQTTQALIYSNLTLFMFDIREGITKDDLFLAHWIKKRLVEQNTSQEAAAAPSPEPKKTRKRQKQNEQASPSQQSTAIATQINNVILVGNKAENLNSVNDIYGEVFKLGFGDPILISAEQGDGLPQLFSSILRRIPLSYYEAFERKKEKRRERYNELKELVQYDIERMQKQGKISSEFELSEIGSELDIFHSNPEENSDFDSDHDEQVKEYLNSFKENLKLMSKHKGAPPKSGSKEKKEEKQQAASDTAQKEEPQPQEAEKTAEAGKKQKKTPPREELNLDTKQTNHLLKSSLENYYLKKKPLQLSVIGRQNSGKSSFINALLKEERLICEDLPGTTRDSISVQWMYKNRKIILVDTAGIDRSMKYKEDVEKLCYDDVMKSIKYSHIIIVMIDALKAFQVPELSLAQYVSAEGRGMIFVVNKWDLIPDQYKKKAIKYMEKQLQTKLGEVKDAKLICISAKTGLNMDRVMDEVIKLYDKWNLRVSTGLLNDWLRKFKKLMKPPTEQGEILVVKFAMQISTRPPTFTVFVNDEAMFKENYFRFMRQSLTKEFGLEGVPIRINIRDPKSQSKMLQESIKQKQQQLKQKKDNHTHGAYETYQIMRKIMSEQRKMANKAEEKVRVMEKIINKIQNKNLQA